MTFSLITALFTAPARADNDDWQRALSRDGNPLAQKLAFWFDVTTNDNTSADTRAMMRFTIDNPDWPQLGAFREKIERRLGASSDIETAEIAGWFDRFAPRTARGISAYVNALIRLEEPDRARMALQNFWQKADINRADINALANQYRNIFPPRAHADRLNNLLWAQRYQDAEVMLPLVSANDRKVATARIALGRLASNASQAVSAVPPALEKDEGLMFDRLRWRRQKNRDTDAVTLLMQMPKNATRPDMWWRERNILARRAIEKRNYAQAYKIILPHGLKSGSDYSQAEWLLGWLSLRFLNKPEQAAKHFEAFNQSVNSAVSKSRGGYWMARTAEALNQPDIAKAWDAEAARYISTFYGQLSHEKLYGAGATVSLPPSQVSAEAKARFEAREPVRAIKMLSSKQLAQYSDPFFIRLLATSETRDDFIMIAQMAKSINRPRHAVEANKQAQQKLGTFLFEEGYPLPPYGLPADPEKAIILAVIHRESMFDPLAQSHAGARGMMQLMPRTAQQVSKSIGQNYALPRLTADPRYNIALGSNYLQGLINDYDGHYPMALAAYNAGPGNVRKWVNQISDPRTGRDDLIDWIELVPIYETRNYIQRVMESYYMYKLRLGEKPRTVTAFKK